MSQPFQYSNDGGKTWEWAGADGVIVALGKLVHVRFFGGPVASHPAGGASPHPVSIGAGEAEASALHTWPAEIYLSTGEDDELLPFDSYHEVSWCDHPTNSVDVRYVRADLAATPSTQQEKSK